MRVSYYYIGLLFSSPSCNPAWRAPKQSTGYPMAPQALQVVFLDRDTISPETVIRPFAFEHELKVYERTSAEQVAERIADDDIVITNKVPLRREALSGAPHLKMRSEETTSELQSLMRI